MPTVVSFPGASVSRLTAPAFCVVKADRVVVSFPPVLRDTTATVYDAPGAAFRSDVQRAPPAAARPASRPPAASVTVTDASVPPDAVTVTCFPAAGATTDTFGGAPSAAADGAAGPPPDPAEQAVRETARATAASTGRDGRMDGTEHLREEEGKGGMPGL
ncbi:hypothetical protein GCM10010305_07580 [Streptomyces termitum]|uniref:Uncharacterized protein n=1 Tax=Streptomyces termitum TaxID=67368 RepID=A0A918SRD3_9ACTN|nr:hypothetical protein GCM10010305_07580 [Streptomyces termitum]